MFNVFSRIYLNMIKYKIISGQIEDHEPHYWIQSIRTRSFFGFKLPTRYTIIGSYWFDTGGAMAQMPFYNREKTN